MELSNLIYLGLTKPCSQFRKHSRAGTLAGMNSLVNQKMWYVTSDFFKFCIETRRKM